MVFPKKLWETAAFPLCPPRLLVSVLRKLANTAHSRFGEHKVIAMFMKSYSC